MSAEEPLERRPADRDAARVPGLAMLAGAAVALGSLPLAALAGAPYLSAEHINGWIVVFAVGLFAALFAAPFALERLQRSRRIDSEQRWERALLAWGAVALATGALGLLLGFAGDFSGDSLAGTVGLIAGIESVLVLGTLLVWILAG